MVRRLGLAVRRITADGTRTRVDPDEAGGGADDERATRPRRGGCPVDGDERQDELQKERQKRCLPCPPLPLPPHHPPPHAVARIPPIVIVRKALEREFEGHMTQLTFAPADHRVARYAIEREQHRSVTIVLEDAEG